MPGQRTYIRSHVWAILLVSLIALLLVAMPAASASSAVHGSVYEWSSFDTVKNAEVVVNSVPQQMIVSRNGTYSFDLDKGTYTIIAKSGNGSDALFARENVTITADGGSYVIDLILFPSSNFDDLSMLDENVSAVVTEEPAAAQPQQSWILPVAIVIFILAAIIGVAGFIIWRRKKGKASKPADIAQAELQQPQAEQVPAAENVEPQPVEESARPSISNNYAMPDDLKEVVHIIEKNGGRITQLDLRKALPYSEAKVSLMITDLESRGIIKKVKKGRGNVIILNTPGNADAE